MSDQLGDVKLRTIDEARVKEADIYESDGVDLEWELVIGDGKLSGPFASDYPLLVEILAHHELPVTENGVESLEGCELPVTLDGYSKEWVAIDSGEIRDRIGLGRIDDD